MLSTLLKIGQWQSEGASEWDRFLEKPKVESKDKKGNKLANYTLPIIFDLDAMDIVIDPTNLKDYDESDVSKFKSLKIQGGNNKAIYTTVPSYKFIQLYKTFFGKEGNDDTTKGELTEAIDKGFPEFQNTKMYLLLQRIFLLKERFVKIAIVEDEKKGSEINIEAIKKMLNLQKGDNLALVYVALKSSEYGIIDTIPFAKLSQYEKFLEVKFLGEPDHNEVVVKDKSLCYASGTLENDVDALDLSNRYSLNKMFVTETKNYASFFDQKNFKTNYQVSKKNQEKLDYASTFLLNNYKAKIANIDHVIIPQFLDKANIDLELVLNGIKKNSDLLFSLNELEEIVKDVEIESQDVFWINFVAYESDGNFFKSTEIIKDVSQFHFNKIIDSFREVHRKMEESEFVNWNSVMTEYNRPKRFNLNSIYSLIPIRKDKEKKNIALDIFKAILENRTVIKGQLFGHFKELMLCHYFKRYKSYTNVHESSSDYFNKTIRDSVFKYLAFIEVLKNLKLIKMESTIQQSEPVAEASGKYDDVIYKFFERMNFNNSQKAMFYLGRMLSTVAFIQKDKNKTVIDKVNYNGMDRDDLIRLRISLIEKAKQYGEIKKVIFADSRFAEYFDFERWNMDSSEALFFLLTGFSFGIKPSTDKDQNNN